MVNSLREREGGREGRRKREKDKERDRERPQQIIYKLKAQYQVIHCHDLEKKNTLKSFGR